MTSPEIPLLGPTLVLLDFAGMAVFAATGALAGARLRQDLVTIIFFAAVTGVGGGTLRDLLIGAPVFWVQDWRYIAVATAAAIAVWFVGGKGWRLNALYWLDAVGLAAYAADEMARIQGRHSGEIEALVGYKGPGVAIHRDDLVLEG